MARAALAQRRRVNVFRTFAGAKHLIATMRPVGAEIHVRGPSGSPAEERGSQGKSYYFDSAAVIAWRIARERNDAVARIGAGVETMTREEVDRRRAIASIKIAEVEADTAQAVVVLRAQVEDDLASFCTALHTGLGSASNGIAGHATLMTSAPKFEDLCHAELNRAFDSAKTSLAEWWAKGA